MKINVNHKKILWSNFLSLNIKKQKKELNWEPRLDLKHLNTADWYKYYFKNKKIEQFTSEQIDFFLKR